MGCESKNRRLRTWIVLAVLACCMMPFCWLLWHGPDVLCIFYAGLRGPEADFFVPYLKHPRKWQRKWAASLLGSSYPMSSSDSAMVIRALSTALNDEEAEVRVHAVQALCRWRGKYPVARLIDLLADPDDSVRVAAASALTIIRASVSISALREVVNDPTSTKTLAEQALSALCELGTPESIAALVSLLEAPQARIRVLAAYGLINVPAYDMWQQIQGCLENDLAGLTDKSDQWMVEHLRREFPLWLIVARERAKAPR